MVLYDQLILFSSFVKGIGCSESNGKPIVQNISLPRRNIYQHGLKYKYLKV